MRQSFAIGADASTILSPVPVVVYLLCKPSYSSDHTQDFGGSLELGGIPDESDALRRNSWIVLLLLVSVEKSAVQVGVEWFLW